MRQVSLMAFLASVGGIGSLPASGTWGSVIGVGCGVLVVRTLPPWCALLLLVLTFIACAFITTRAATYYHEHDPHAVILDEVWGMAAVFVILPWTGSSVLWGLGAFLLFRLFDIVKPPPLRLLERCPAGWGIMADDGGAAVYTAAVLFLIHRLIR